MVKNRGNEAQTRQTSIGMQRVEDEHQVISKTP